MEPHCPPQGDPVDSRHGIAVEPASPAARDGACPTPDPVSAPSVSILVPFIDEALNLPSLIAELRAALDRFERPAEVVLIDDGSKDESVSVARAAISEDWRFSIVRLRSQSGKSAALSAGCDHSHGEILVTLDADMQDPPSEIPKLIARIDAGDDLVVGWRKRRKTGLHRRALSTCFNFLVARTTGTGLHDLNCGLKACRRAAFESIYLSTGMHRFIPVVAHARGFRVSELPIETRPRMAGRSKYGVWRYFETCLGLLTVLCDREPPRSPACALGAGGLVLLIVAALAAAGLSWLGGADTLAAGTAIPWILVAMIGLLGTQLIVCGLLGELLLLRLARAGKGSLYRLREGETLPQ